MPDRPPSSRRTFHQSPTEVELHAQPSDLGLKVVTPPLSRTPSQATQLHRS